MILYDLQVRFNSPRNILGIIMRACEEANGLYSRITQFSVAWGHNKSEMMDGSSTNLQNVSVKAVSKSRGPRL